MNTRAILNINSNDIKEAKARKQVRIQKDNELTEMKVEIRELRNMVNELIENKEK